MAAHNEEKLISPALERLIKIHEDYPEMEVLIGLDGCTDKTLEVVRRFSKRYRFFKVFDFQKNEGKQRVIEKLEPHIKGDIIVIHDADKRWMYKSKKDILNYLKIFDNKKIGGVAAGSSSEKDREDFWEIDSIGFLSSAWGNHFLIEYVKNNFSAKRGGIRIYNEKKLKFLPFLEVYRKEAMSLTKSDKRLGAGDHVERSLRILKAKYNIADFDNHNWPHFVENYNKQRIKDLINQKIRGIVAKRRVNSIYNFKIPFFGFYIPFSLYIIRKSFGLKRWKDFLACYIYLFIMFYASVVSKLKGSEEIWKFRIKR